MAGELLTAAEAGSLLRLNVKRVQALARTGEIPAVRRGRRWLFPRAALMRQLDASTRARADEAVRPKPRALERGVNISARNQLNGRIVSLVADGVMAEIRIAIGDQEIVAIITRSSAERLGLREGEEVIAVVKSTEVMVATPAGEESV